MAKRDISVAGYSMFPKGKCFSWTFEHCKAEREQMCCYSPFPSCKVKLCWTTALWKLGKSGSLLLLANKTRLVLQRNPILMVRKPKTWQVLFPFQVSTQVELIGTASYARIASNLTAKVGSRGFLVGEGNSSVKLKKPWRITPNSPKFSCLGSSMWRDAELYLLVLPTSSRDATFVGLGLQCLANGTDLPKEGRVSCLLLISPPQKRR